MVEGKIDGAYCDNPEVKIDLMEDIDDKERLKLVGICDGNLCTLEDYINHEWLGRNSNQVRPFFFGDNSEIRVHLDLDGKFYANAIDDNANYGKFLFMF
jgi:hypothetical protein